MESGPVGALRPNRSRQLLEQPRLARPQVEVAAEDQRRIAGPGDGRLGSVAHVRLRQLAGLVLACRFATQSPESSLAKAIVRRSGRRRRTSSRRSSEAALDPGL